MSDVKDAFTHCIVDLVEEFRLDFHVAMMGAKTVEERTYLVAGISHAACVILATAWPPNQPRDEFRKMMIESFPRLLDGALNSVEKQRLAETELFSKILRQAGAMQ